MDCQRPARTLRGIKNAAASHVLAAKRFAADRNGATAIEYGLIAASIAVVIITAVQLLGTN